MAFGAEYGFSKRWGIIARLYIRIFGMIDLASRVRARALISELKRIPMGTVVDFGCGTGAYAFFISRDPLRKVIAVDIDPQRVADILETSEAISRNQLRVICADELFFLRPGGAEYAGVIASEVLVYCKNLGDLLSSIQKSILPGGYFVAHIPVRASLQPFEHHLLDKTSLYGHLIRAGFHEVEIRPTMGAGARGLCALFDLIAPQKMLLAVLFPFLLIATKFTSLYPSDGDSLLVIARKL